MTVFNNKNGLFTFIYISLKFSIPIKVCCICGCHSSSVSQQKIANHWYLIVLNCYSP